MSIAGFDPSGGAGVLADVKTFEQMKVQGIAVSTGMTLQTETKFHYTQWRRKDDLFNEIRVLLESYPIKSVKFGIVEDLSFLLEACKIIKNKNRNTFIIVDPVVKSTTGYHFTDYSDPYFFKQLFSFIDVLTPNVDEMKIIQGNSTLENFMKNIPDSLAVYLKGGHDRKKPGLDVLYHQGYEKLFYPQHENVSSKHGSGCVLSSALAANLALGRSLEDSCQAAKRYIEHYLSSSKTLSGTHA